MPVTPWSRRVPLLLSVLLALLACGGEGTGPVLPPAPPPGPPPPPPPPPPPAAVASVVVTPGTADLAPLQALQLTATPRDAQGTPLTGRSVSWTTSAQAVATVSGTGLVTAAAAGTTIITATSEGQSGTATITVAPGVVVGPQGGTFAFEGGAITVSVPAGALASPITLSASPAGGTPATAPPAGWQFAGPMFVLSPAGATFSQPVTVTVRYDPADLPSFVMTGDLGLLQSAGGTWQGLTDLAVDVTAGTLSGRTTAFGGAAVSAAGGGLFPDGSGDGGTQVGLAVLDPEIELTPMTNSVNDAHRVAILHVIVSPRGQGIPLPATAQPILYRWRSTNQRGGISDPNPDSWGSLMEMQYTATDPQLSSLTGEIDRVFVDVLLNPESLTDQTAGPPRIVTAEAVIDADLEVTYDILPPSTTVDAGDTKDLRLVIRDKQGQELQLPGNQEVEWQSTDNHGSIPAGLDPKQVTVTYTADTEFEFAPPRVEEITVIVTQKNTHDIRVAKATPIGGFINDYQTDHVTVVEKGRAKSFVTVHVDYEVTLESNDDKIAVGSSTQLAVTIDPDEQLPGIFYRYTTAGTHGTLSVPTGQPTSSVQINYEAHPLGPGGTETIEVEVLSMIGSTVLETLGTAQAMIEVDPWRSGSFGVAFMQANCQAPFIYIPKVVGATQYQVLADGFNHPDLGTEYTHTFSGASGGTEVFSVVDMGNSFRIRMEGGGCAVSPGAQDAQRAAMFSRFSGIQVRYKATD